jgi:very-short-patch-repair endonuclease
MELPTLNIDQKNLHTYYKSAMSEAHKKIARRWQTNGENIQLELLFPNDKKNRNPYSIDILLPDYLTMIEIDGACHDDRLERDNKRDNYIMSIAQNTGVDWNLKRIPLDIPENLIYGHLRDSKRQNVKDNYISWLNKLADKELFLIKQEYNLKRLENLKNNI